MLQVLGAVGTDQQGLSGHFLFGTQWEAPWTVCHEQRRPSWWGAGEVLRLGAGWDWGGNRYGQTRRKKSGKPDGTTCKIPLESETLRNWGLQFNTAVFRVNMILPVLEERKLQDWKKQGSVPGEKWCGNKGYFKEHTARGGGVQMLRLLMRRERKAKWLAPFWQFFIPNRLQPLGPCR